MLPPSNISGPQIRFSGQTNLYCSPSPPLPPLFSLPPSPLYSLYLPLFPYLFLLSLPFAPLPLVIKLNYTDIIECAWNWRKHLQVIALHLRVGCRKSLQVHSLGFIPIENIESHGRRVWSHSNSRGLELSACGNGLYIHNNTREGLFGECNGVVIVGGCIFSEVSVFARMSKIFQKSLRCVLRYWISVGLNDDSAGNIIIANDDIYFREQLIRKCVGTYGGIWTRTSCDLI